MYELNEHLLREKSKTPAIAGCQTHARPDTSVRPRHICCFSLTVGRFTWLIKPVLRLLKLALTFLHFFFY